MASIAVVVPYFSREKSILAGTVRAALRQRGVPTPLIIVVDDGSPWPAAEELAQLNADELAHVRVLRQENQGAPAARNAGLAALPDDAEWLAMLDADDIWKEDHLLVAIEALEQGFDFYFTNCQRQGNKTSHFESCGFNPAPHRKLDVGASLYAFEGNFFSRCIRLAPVCLSTVVVRRPVFQSFRFPSIPWTFEDLGFFLEAATRTSRIAFNSALQVQYGPGGIAEAEGVVSNLQLRRDLCYVQHFHNVGRRYTLTPEQARLVDAARRDHVRSFTAVLLNLCRAGIMPDWKYVGQFLAQNPGAVWVAGEMVMSKLWRRLPLVGRRRPATATPNRIQQT
jgi:succinoglycan biosynthesis protein ExoW